MIDISTAPQPAALLPKLHRLFDLSTAKVRSLESKWRPESARRCSPLAGNTPAAAGRSGRRASSSAARFCSSMPPAKREFLEIGRERTVDVMAPHVTHIGVHDHGFNNVSTYGNLLRLMNEGRIPENEWERRFYEMALKCSGAVQAARWARTADGGGYIYSFNGPHSLFVDTIRTLRALAVSHRPGARADGRERSEDLAARPRRSARARHREVLGVLRRRPRRLRRPRPHRARERLQHERRQLSAARIRSRATRRSAPGRAAWPGPCAASPNNWNSSTPSDRPRRDQSDHGEGRARHLRLLHREHAARRHSVLGHRRAGSGATRRLAVAARPIRSTRTSRWTVRRPPSPRRGCCVSDVG